MSAPVVFVAGSPSPTSRSSLVARAVADALVPYGIQTRSFYLGDFAPPHALLARTEAPAVASFVAAARSAPALVLATPVYKATYAGALKALVDLVPPDALVGKPAMGIATSRLPEHGLSAAAAYKALFGHYRARALDTLVVLDAQFEGEGASITLGPGAGWWVGAAARSLRLSLSHRPAPRFRDLTLPAGVGVP
jgi:FMN reductase